MEMRMFGGLWPVSALTMGGGGIGQVWGATSARNPSPPSARQSSRASPSSTSLTPTGTAKPRRSLERRSTAASRTG